MKNYKLTIRITKNPEASVSLVQQDYATLRLGLNDDRGSTKYDSIVPMSYGQMKHHVLASCVKQVADISDTLVQDGASSLQVQLEGHNPILPNTQESLEDGFYHKISSKVNEMGRTIAYDKCEHYDPWG